MEQWSDVVKVLVGPVVIVVAIFVVGYVNGVVNDVISAWFGRITGLTAWQERVRLVERKLGHPALWRTTQAATTSGVVLLAVGWMMARSPQPPWERGDATFVFVLAAILLLVALVAGTRWWRVSGGVADADARRTP